jgi:ferritin
MGCHISFRFLQWGYHRDQEEEEKDTEEIHEY